MTRPQLLAQIQVTALALVAPLSTATFASEAPHVLSAISPQRTVHFADLNLASDAGIEVLYRRLRAAAANVCDARGDLSLKAQNDARSCRNMAVQNAVSTIALPRLTSLHLARTHGRPDQAATS